VVAVSYSALNKVGEGVTDLIETNRVTKD